MSWTFLDYVDSNGLNQIEAWLDTLPRSARAGVRAKLTGILMINRVQEQLRPPRFDSLPGRPLFKINFDERRVAYRVLFFYGPGRKDVTLLAGAVERNDRYRPPGVFDTAARRREEVLSDRRRAVPTCLFLKSS
jgi:hypothetical protein